MDSNFVRDTVTSQWKAALIDRQPFSHRNTVPIWRGKNFVYSTNYYHSTRPACTIPFQRNCSVIFVPSKTYTNLVLFFCKHSVLVYVCRTFLPKRTRLIQSTIRMCLARNDIFSIEIIFIAHKNEIEKQDKRQIIGLGSLALGWYRPFLRVNYCVL